MVDDAIRFVAGHQNQKQTKDKDKKNDKSDNDDNRDKIVNEFEIETSSSAKFDNQISKQETTTTEATPISNQVF